MQFRKPFHLDILILFDNNSWVSGDYIQNVRISFRGNSNNKKHYILKFVRSIRAMTTESSKS